MSQKKLTHWQMMWYKAVHLTIANEQRLTLGGMDAAQKGYEALLWRLGYNLYNAGDYEEAMGLLERVTEMDERKVNKQKSVVHQTAGRCAVQMFRESGEHKHLEVAYRHFQQAVECMVINLFTMFQLPLLLLEFGRVLEDYGAFEAANDVYGRILSSFPNFRGYFDALYRSAIVGRHLASLVEGATREDALSKCMDVLQFLLEALPQSISDIQIVLLYGRTMELSSNPSIRIRAHSVYHSLHELCRAQSVAGANMVSDPAQWLADPKCWLALAEDITASGEPIVAKDAFEKFMELTEKQAAMSYKFEERNVAAHLDVATCLKLANAAAHYQNYEQAVKYAELGLQIDRYHKVLREHLATWSKQHAVTMHGEKDAVRTILSVWKGRCWTAGFRKKLKQRVVDELEGRYKEKRWDAEARAGLCYYAKEQYRNRFLWEETCVVRVQRWVRERRRHFVWTAATRQHRFGVAQEVLRRFNRFPRSALIRAELVLISLHPKGPRRPHAIHTAADEIHSQGGAVQSIEKSFRAFLCRKALHKRVMACRERQHVKAFRAVCVIQSVFRRKKAVIFVDTLRVTRFLYIEAARVLQKWCRKRRNSFYHLVHWKRTEVARKRAWAMRVLTNKLPSLVLTYLMLHRVNLLLRERKKADDAAWQGQIAERLRLEGESKLIANYHKAKHSKFLSKLSRSADEQRLEADFSFSALDVVNAASVDPQASYAVPGVDIKDQKFVRATQQKTIFCQEGFSAADCMMLSMVLRSPACACKVLVLYLLKWDACFDDLLDAIRQNHSLRAVYILGGKWKLPFLLSLVHLSRVENARVGTLVIEKIEQQPRHCSTLGLAAGALVKDYFNYSIPGLREMSLHGCSLTNADIELVAEGLAVNSSLQRLTLSLNLIDDVGFLALFRALSGNKKSQLVGLDCSYNLLQGGQAAKVAFLQYEAPHPHTQLVVNLMFNRILEYYHPAIHLSTIGDVTPLALLYTSEDLVALHYANHKLSDRQTHEQEKGEHSNSNSNSGTAGSKGGRGRGGGRGGKGGEVRRSSKYILLKGREGFDPQTLSSKPPPRPPTGPAGGVGAGGAYLEPAYAHASASMDVQESQQQWAEMEGVLRTRSARNRSRSRGGSFDPGPSITPSNTSPPSSPSIKFRKSLTANI